MSFVASRCLVLAAVGLLAGCASSQMSRIDANRDVYETWPIEMRQLVLDGKVEPGMTQEMVEVSWGKPTEVVSRGLKPGDDDVWIYRTTRDDTMGSSPTMSGSTRPTISMGGSMNGIGIGNSGMGASSMPGGGIMSSSGGMVGGGSMLPPTQTITEERQVEFRDGVVHHADPPLPK